MRGELLLLYLLSRRLGDEVLVEGDKARFVTMGRIFIALWLHNIWTTRNDKVYKDLDPPEPHIRVNLVWRKGKDVKVFEWVAKNLHPKVQEGRPVRHQRDCQCPVPAK